MSLKSSQSLSSEIPSSSWVLTLRCLLPNTHIHTHTNKHIGTTHMYTHTSNLSDQAMPDKPSLLSDKPSYFL